MNATRRTQSHLRQHRPQPRPTYHWGPCLRPPPPGGLAVVFQWPTFANVIGKNTDGWLENTRPPMRQPSGDDGTCSSARPGRRPCRPRHTGHIAVAVVDVLNADYVVGSSHRSKN